MDTLECLGGDRSYNRQQIGFNPRQHCVRMKREVYTKKGEIIPAQFNDLGDYLRSLRHGEQIIKPKQ